MSTPQSNFIQLTHEEVLPKLKRIAAQHEMIKIWKRGEDSHIYRVSDIQNLKIGGESIVLISMFSEGEELDNQLMNQDVLLSFVLNDIDYFSEGNIGLDESEGKLILKLDQKVFRSEKRNNERLLTFPHHQVYAYFRIRADENDNVVKFKREEDSAYLEFKKQQKEKIKKELSGQFKDSDELIGFRALDISFSGIAFLVGAEEKDFFYKEKNFDFIIVFDGETFEISHSKLIYGVDFLNRTNSDARYKIGLNFNPLPDLTTKLNLILSRDESFKQIHREFEEFSDD